MSRSSTPEDTVTPRRPKSPEDRPAQAREPRGARRKRETREKLLRAAFRLFGERGVDAVAISEITEAADVGFGSFYNHFASKEAVHEAVVDAMFDQFGDTLERLTMDVADPAEVIAICVRHTILRAKTEPLWGSFFVRQGLGVPAVTRGLGVRLLRDVQRGVEAARFSVADPMMTIILAGGCVMATIAAQRTEDGGALATRLGFDGSNLASRAATVILESLGLEHAEAEEIGSRPLPRLVPAPSKSNA